MLLGPLKIMFFLGTRAEAIKLAPIISAMRHRPETFKPVLIVSSTHSPLLQQALRFLRLQLDFDLQAPVMGDGGDLEALGNMMHNFNNVINAAQPDMMVVIGDTTITLAGSLCAFYHRLPLAHVEAGLRTYDKAHPFPDEMQRQLTDVLADLYFAPTQHAAHNLLQEHHQAEQVFVTGNPVVDSVRLNLRDDYRSPLLDSLPADHRLILLTMQRLENRGEPMERVFRTMRDIVETNPDVELLCPLYPADDVMSLADQVFTGCARVHVVSPMNLGEYLNTAARSYLLVTDSAGVVEEAPALHKPVLLLREKTERPEAIIAGCAQVVGTDPTTIQQAAFDLLHNKRSYKKMAAAPNPFGDGFAADRIINLISHYFTKK